MALPSLIQAIQARFRGTNNNAWNATTNPLGFGNGGHRQNLPPRLTDMADVLGYVSDAVDAVEADRGEVATNKQAASDSAGAAAQSAGDAAGSAGDAAASAAKLIATSASSVSIGTGSKTLTTQAGKAFGVGSRLTITNDASPSTRIMYGTVTAYSGTSLTVSVDVVVGLGTYAAWTLRLSGDRGAQGVQGIPGISTLGYEARSSNTALVTADSAHWYDLTGTFTQTFAAASAIGVDWFVILRNAGTGDITLDPNGSETIDGLTSFIMYPGEVRLIQCNGTAFRSIVYQAFTKSFLASSTFLKPPGYRAFGGMLWSGGSSGSKAAEQGGSGGGCFPFDVLASTLASSEPIVIGAGGAPSTTTSWNFGGNSSFAGLTVQGGQGPNTGGGIMIPYTTGDVRWGRADAFGVGSGNGGSIYGGASAGYSNNTAGTLWGGGGGGGYTGSTLYPPTPTKRGGAGGAASLASNGGDGQQPGGGGGATSTGTQSGAGGAGQLDIWGII